MKPDLVEIVYILDRSGSMGPLTEETIAGYNAFLRQQRSLDGTARITTVLFDDQYEVLGDGVEIANARKLTRARYAARGTTALLDAVGKAVDSVGKRLAATEESERPMRVIVAITTDGQENASREYTYERVREMVRHQQEKYGWTFLFAGANIDVGKEAWRIGIDGENTIPFDPTPLGVQEMNLELWRRITEIREAVVRQAAQAERGMDGERGMDAKRAMDAEAAAQDLGAESCGAAGIA